MIRGFLSLYRPRYARVIVRLLQDNQYRAWDYLKAYWHTADFSRASYLHDFQDTAANRILRRAVAVGMIVQLLVAAWVAVLWHWEGLSGGSLFALALLVSYPVVWAHVLALVAGVRNAIRLLAHPKKLGRSIVCRILEGQVRKLLRRNEVKIVAVAGSVGKTSTKLAVAKLLECQFRVRFQNGNYNDRVTVPLVFFGRREPNILNIFAWLKIFVANARALSRPYPYDVVVVELGTDHPGSMIEFGYLPVDIAVVTAVTPEHMEYFKTLDAVAAEELTVFDFADTVLVNGDAVPAEYLVGRKFREYSLRSDQANYFAAVTDPSLAGQKLRLRLANGHSLSMVSRYVGEPGASIVLAAASVADQLDAEHSEIAKGIANLEPFAGRMQLLNGQKDSVLIDDTYNASPVAVEAALDVLYAQPAKQRIAILGSMNELGDYSPAAHKEVGKYCDPKKLDLVVTIGHDAKKYLAPAAKKAGCTVHTFLSPYEAGDFVLSKLRKGALVLAEGSQNGVFAEESLKPLLADPADADKLVRQSKYWLKKKQQQFRR
ncbi:MAG TPA: Mur ligase family protein [Candidatus Saccharimonadales bacterium]|nr:Mur ligase family protein [Candidatus Saccharimonadales bacterium]